MSANSPTRVFGLILVLCTWGCRTAQPDSTTGSELYERLEQFARDPAMRPAVCTILSDDRHPFGWNIASDYRRDEDATVRASCYRWLVSVDGDRRGAWLEEGLNDPAIAVQVACLLQAHRVAAWSRDVDEALRRILNTTTRGHVFRYAAQTLTDRYGQAGALDVWDVVSRRGMGWEPSALAALCQYPQPEFRDAFERSIDSDDWDVTCFALRGLNALNSGQLGNPGDAQECFSTEEFHQHWDQDIFRLHEPEVLGRADLTQRMRAARVIVLGELHAWLPTRGAQIDVLAGLAHFAHDNLALVCERPVLEYQQPVIDAARQYGIDVLMLEEEPLASNGSPSARDESVRQRLAEVLAEDPDRTYVICYGDNHRASLQQVARSMGLPNMAIALFPTDGMLGSAVRKTGGAIEGLCFAYPEDNYFLACGSFAAILGCPELDDAFAGSGSLR